ncbi:MAG: Gfo/Idh/MocA family oxidoreductase [bacterium]|nr:Gfo/Idh/MocA family oxidoreductase [bacterium]
MSKQVTAVLVGAGNRGRGIFGQYALDMPHRMRFTGVVEPDEEKRRYFAGQHGISAEMCFGDYREFYAASGRSADAVIVATLENERVDPILGALKAGYHVLTEKPLGTNLNEIIRITDAAAEYDGVFIVCHQMRYIPLYNTLKRLIDSGDYGNIVSIQHSENLSYSHMAHSFVRGVFNSSSMTPMILAKSCHDMDFLRWLIDRRPLQISSFGSLQHFVPQNAPEGAPERCLDGCPAEPDCPYSVLKLYFNDDTDLAYIRQMGVIEDRRQLMESLKTNRFGRCVYRCDNDVVDNQVVQMLFDGGVTVNFTMCGHNAIERRITKISLDNGELVLDLSEGVIHAHTFSPLVHNIVEPSVVSGTHGGGDRVIMDSFVDAVSTGDKSRILTSVEASLDSHVMAFAAEESRLSGRVVDVPAFESEARQNGIAD